jgi:acyl carrier protein
MTRDEIFETISEILSESFELDRAEIKRESKLYEELGLDSIDAVDIFVQLREVTGRRPDPAIAREIRTVDELITFVENELAAAAAGLPEPDVQRPGVAQPAAATAGAAAATAPAAKKASGGRG